MRFYEINEMLRTFNEAYENGEIDEAAYTDTLEGLEMAQDEKIENIACLYKERVAEAEAVKGEAKKLSERAATITKSADRLKEFLTSCMFAAEKEKFKTSRVQIGFRRSTRLDVVDGEKFLAYAKANGLGQEVFAPDKTEIKKRILDGATDTGAALSEHQNIQVK